MIIDITIEASLRIHVGITTNNHNEIIDTILVVFGKATGRNEKKVTFYAKENFIISFKYNNLPMDYSKEIVKITTSKKYNK